MKTPRSGRFALRLTCALLVAAILPASAATGFGGDSLPELSAPQPLAEVGDYFSDWFERSEGAKAEQPHWITPLVTVTPRLEQEVRFDQFWQAQPHGLGQSISGAKLELIPLDNIELILGAPPYVAKSKYNVKHRHHGLDNWTDVSFLVKYRLLSANEEQGNYIVTLFMGISAPTGSKRLGSGHAVYSPTIAFGKGWGDFDFQSTVAIAIPNGGEDRLGMPVTYNTALQYRILKKIWPELEFNYTWWPNGARTGDNQLFVTPGIVIGRLPIWKTLGFTIGTGVQIAVTQHRTFDRNWILSARLPF